MSKRRDHDLLGDIQEATRQIAAYTADMTYAELSQYSMEEYGWPPRQTNSSLLRC